MPKISAKTQITFLELPARLNKMIWSEGMYTVRSLREKTEAELGKIFTPAQLATIIAAMSKHGTGPKGYEPNPTKPKKIPEIKTIVLPVGGGSKLGEQILALMTASGIEATKRFTKQYQAKVADTLEAALAAHKEKIDRPQPTTEPANCPIHAPK